ncbi:MAG: hypothetical protein RR327_02000 [Clostridia bacterium]
MTAFELAEEIAKVFSRAPTIPFDTGNLKNNGVFAVEVSERSAYVVIGGEPAPYAWELQYNDFVELTGNLNRHQGFIGKIVNSNVIPYLEMKYGARRE